MGFKIAILISGRGSNMKNIIEACNNKKLCSSVNLVVSNKSNAYGLKIAKIPKDEINSRVQKAAKILEIQDYLERKPNQLSGGQRQRVAMGRAIVRNPVAFLFDEPLSNLDAKLRVQMRLEIKKLQTQLKTTSLFVTHDQVEAMTLADRMIVMNEGNVEHIGSPLEVYTKPKTLFTAQFIGSPAMNILKGDCKNNIDTFSNQS